MKLVRHMFAVAVAACFCLSANAQVDKHDVRKGNREFNKGQYKEADVDYRKAVLRDTTSFAANYNLANTQYRLAGGQNAQGSMDEANKFYKAIEQQAATSEYGADYWFNVGDAALASKDYKTAVDAFRKSLLMNPGDIDAKENYIYAKKMLEDQEQNGGGGDNNQDNNQDNQDNNQDQNNDQNQDQNQNNDNQDQNDDQNQDNQDKDQNQDQPQDNQQDQQQQQGISPQQAQQMLQAIQAKEKETQEKVEDKLKAAAKAKQKEKNW